MVSPTVEHANVYVICSKGRRQSQVTMTRPTPFGSLLIVDHNLWSTARYIPVAFSMWVGQHTINGYGLGNTKGIFSKASTNIQFCLILWSSTITIPPVLGCLGWKPSWGMWIWEDSSIGFAEGKPSGYIN